MKRKDPNRLMWLGSVRRELEFFVVFKKHVASNNPSSNHRGLNHPSASLYIPHVMSTNGCKLSLTRYIDYCAFVISSIQGLVDRRLSVGQEMFMRKLVILSRLDWF